MSIIEALRSQGSQTEQLTTQNNSPPRGLNPYSPNFNFERVVDGTLDIAACSLLREAQTGSKTRSSRNPSRNCDEGGCITPTFLRLSETESPFPAVAGKTHFTLL
jgi:hypothetical protein